jgi:hypothetical protein
MGDESRVALRALDQVCTLGRALGGRGANRLAPFLGLTVTSQTMLRGVKAAEAALEDASLTVRVLFAPCPSSDRLPIDIASR